jgi:spermidine synthase
MCVLVAFVILGLASRVLIIGGNSATRLLQLTSTNATAAITAAVIRKVLIEFIIKTAPHLSRNMGFVLFQGCAFSETRANNNKVMI